MEVVLPARNLEVLTNSRLAVARQCQRKHHMMYELGYRPVVKSEALHFGTLAHLGLAEWWRPGEARLQRAVDAIMAERPDPFDAAKLHALLSGYSARWGGEQYETLAVEVEFEAPLVNPLTGKLSRTYRLAGKIDAIVKDARGRVLIVEHKTSSGDIGVGSAYWKRLILDAQVGLYHEGARALGYEACGCLYDVLCKPSIRPFKATPSEDRKYKKDGTLYSNQHEVDESPTAYNGRCINEISNKPDSYFVRGEVVRLEEQLRDALFDVWSLGRQLREGQLAGRWPANPESCVNRYNSVCEYWPVCAGEGSLDDPNLYRKSKRQHEELTLAA